MEYLVVIEQADDGTFSAYVPDLPGCVSSGDSIEAVKVAIEEAIHLHIESLRDHGESIPQPASSSYLISL